MTKGGAGAGAGAEDGDKDGAAAIWAFVGESVERITMVIAAVKIMFSDIVLDFSHSMPLQ